MWHGYRQRSVKSPGEHFLNICRNAPECLPPEHSRYVQELLRNSRWHSTTLRAFSYTGTKGQNQRFALASTTLRAFSYTETKWACPLCASPHNCLCNLPLCGDRILAERFFLYRKRQVSYKGKNPCQSILSFVYSDRETYHFIQLVIYSPSSRKRLFASLTRLESG